MQIRPLIKDDLNQVKTIFNLYWNDQEFIEELTGEAKEFVNKTNKSVSEKYTYYVAENSNEILGIIGFRKSPSHMSEYTKSAKPAELYILASKNHGQGTGKILVDKMLNNLHKDNYTEVVLYSPNTHNAAWGFYDHLGFERVGKAIAPDGEPGMIWRMILST